MIKKVFSLLHKDISGLHEAAYILAFSAFLSQILALLRDRMLAHSFGAGEILDIYYASFRVPDFIFISIASLVSLAVLVPFLSQEIDKKYIRRFMNEIFSVFFILITVVSVVVFFFLPKIIPLLFRGFSADALQEVIVLARIMLLSPILLGISNFCASIIQVNKKFFIYALSPILYNIGIILGILLFYPIWGLKGLALGVVLGAFFHLGIQIPSIARLKFLPRLTLPQRWGAIKKMMALSIPRTLALSLNSFAFLVLVAVASSLGEGAISVFIFAFALQSIPLSIIGVSYSTASFPILSKLFRDNQKEFFCHISISAKHIIFWTISASALFIVLRAQIVRTILGTGEFSWTDTRLTAACLAIFAVSITAQSLILLFVKAYYASGRTKRPVFINIFSSICVIGSVFLFKWLFVYFPIVRAKIGEALRVSDVANIDVLILPLGFSAGALLNVLLLYIFFKKDFRPVGMSLRKSFLQVLGASVVMGVATYFSLEIWNNVFNMNTFIGIFLQGFLAGITGIAVLIIVLKLVGNAEINEILNYLKKHPSIPEGQRPVPELPDIRPLN